MGAYLVVVLVGEEGVCVSVRVCRVLKITQKRRLWDHSANMSTEIKLVYYFQRGKKITKQKSSHILH